MDSLLIFSILCFQLYITLPFFLFFVIINLVVFIGNNPVRKVDEKLFLLNEDKLNIFFFFTIFHKFKKTIEQVINNNLYFFF